MKRLKLALVAACPFPANRGTPSRILRMAEGLSDRGHDVHVVTYHFGTDTKTRGIHLHRTMQLPYRYFEPGPTLTKLAVLDPLLVLKLLKVVQAEKIDLIHAHHFEGALAAYLVRKWVRVKVIYDAHTTLSGELSTYRFLNNRSFSNWLDRKVPESADHVIAVSETLVEFLREKGIGPKKIDVIPTGVNPAEFESQDAGRIKSIYQLRNKRIVMYTGSMARFQQVEYLVDAMTIILQKEKNVVLILVGNTKMKEIEQYCRKKGIQENVIFHGERSFEEIPLFLASADVVVSPRTVCPGIPQKLTNYMAAKKAIVSFKGSAKLLRHGHNGLVVDDGDTDAMAAAILTLLRDKDLRERLGRNARRTLTGNFDWDSLCQRIEGIYYRLMEE